MLNTYSKNGVHRAIGTKFYILKVSNKSILLNNKLRP